MNKKKFKKYLQILRTVLICSSLTLILLSSIVSLYKDRNEIIFFTKQKIPFSKYKNNENIKQENYFWAMEIMKGGYILHFRHAEREKWIDVQMYDSLESDVKNNGSLRLAENDYFAKAVCLSERGTIKAKAIGEHLENINLPIGYVISSTSCRARQTAELSFGGYDDVKRILVHKGPYYENQKERVSKLKELYLNLPIENQTNTIVTAHNSVVHGDMFENIDDELTLEEGGFYIISKKNGKLFLEYEFHNFRKFISAFYKR